MEYASTTTYAMTPWTYLAVIGYFVVLGAAIYYARRLQPRPIVVAGIFMCLFLAPIALFAGVIGVGPFLRNGLWIPTLAGAAIVCAAFAMGVCLHPAGSGPSDPRSTL